MQEGHEHDHEHGHDEEREREEHLLRHEQREEEVGLALGLALGHEEHEEEEGEEAQQHESDRNCSNEHVHDRERRGHDEQREESEREEGWCDSVTSSRGGRAAGEALRSLSRRRGVSTVSTASWVYLRSHRAGQRGEHSEIAVTARRGAPRETRVKSRVHGARARWPRMFLRAAIASQPGWRWTGRTSGGCGRPNPSPCSSSRPPPSRTPSESEQSW